MQETSHFNTIPYCFSGHGKPTSNPWVVPCAVPKPLIVEIFLHLFDEGSFKSVGALRSTCRFMWDTANHPRLWQRIHQSLPLSEYDNLQGNDYYNLCREYKNAAKNVRDVAQKKYWMIQSDGVAIHTKNIITIRLDQDYICRLFCTKHDKIDKEKKWQRFGKFLIFKKENELEVFNLSHGKTRLLNIKDDFVEGKKTFDELSITIPGLRCFGKKFLPSFHYDAKLKKIHMDIWDLETGECQRSQEILDTSKSRNVGSFCRQLPFIAEGDHKRKLQEEDPFRKVTIYQQFPPVIFLV
jgi:hypothetical protein